MPYPLSPFVALVAIALSACHVDGPVLSNVSTDATVINGIPVPPDPGALADATLLGVDVNQNGVRDEVERQIALQYGKNPAHYDAVMRASKFMQDYIKVNGDSALSTAATIAGGNAGACIADKFADDSIEGIRAIDYSFAITVNTLARIRAYQATSLASKEVAHKVPKNPCQ